MNEIRDIVKAIIRHVSDVLNTVTGPLLLVV